MKKRSLVITALILLSASVTYAQPRKGDWMVGANAHPVSFRGAYFLSNRLTVGIDLWPYYTNHRQNKTWGVNFNPNASIRYYFAPKDGMQIGKFNWFGDYSLGCQLNYGYDKINKVGGFNSQLVTGIAPGLMYLINDRVSVDAALRLKYYVDFKNTWSHLLTTPELGIQIYLYGKKNSAKVAE